MGNSKGGSSAVSPWAMIQPGELMDVPGRFNQLGHFMNLMAGVQVKRGSEEGFFISNSNAVIQLKERDVLEKTTGNEAGIGGGGGGGDGEAGDVWVWKGQWTDVNFDEFDVVIRETSAELDDGTVAGTYLALQAVTSGSPAPGVSGAELLWVRIARGNWDHLRISNGVSTQYCDFDSVDGVHYRDGNVVTHFNDEGLLAENLGTVAEFATVKSTGFDYTDGTRQAHFNSADFKLQPAANVFYDFSTTTFDVEFSDASGFEISKVALDGEKLAVIDVPYCDSGVSKTLRVVGAIITP